MPAGIETVLNDAAGLAKRVYDTGVIDQEQRLTITYDELPTKNWNPSGIGWFGDAHLIRASSFKFASSQEELPQDTREVSQQFNITTVEHTGQTTMTLDFIQKMRGGITSFDDYMYKVEDALKSAKKNLNQSCYIGQSMVRTSITNAVTATTFNVANAQYLFNGMFIDIYDAAGTTLVFNNLQITNIDGLAVTIAGAPITTLVGYTIFLHQENLGASPAGGLANKGFNSLPFMADDGTDFSVTYEGLSRTTFPAWRGVRLNAAGNPLTNDLLQNLQNQIYIQSGNDYQTEDYVNFIHPDSVRRYLTIVLPQKRYINASKYDAGMEKPNMLEWNGRGLVQDPDCTKNMWLMMNKAHAGKMEVAPLGIESMLGGTSMKWKSNYTQGIVVSYYNGAIGTDKNSCHGKVVNLQAVS